MKYYEKNGAGYLKLENRIYSFSGTTGTVLEGGANKYVETHVHGSGGGGYVSTINGSGGGYVAPVQISSSNTVNQEFWLKGEDGSEIPIKLYDSDIPVRPGQKITMVSANLEGTDVSWWAMLVNHTSGQHYYLSEVNKKLFKNRKVMQYVPAIVSGIVGTFLFGNKPFGIEFWFGFIAIAGLSFKFLFSPIAAGFQNKDREKSKQVLNDLAQALHKNA